MRTLAIDLGTKRIGLALSDEGGRFATPLDVLEVTAPEQAIPRIASLVRTEAVARLLVGLPLNMDDTSGPAAHATRAWAKQLAAACGIAVVFVDERLSSFEAEDQIRQMQRAGARLTRGQKKGRLDALAACHFLQAFLDGKLPPIELPEMPRG